MKTLPQWFSEKLADFGITAKTLEDCLGPYVGWPESLQHSAAAVVQSGFPMFLVWGANQTFVYNKAYLNILGEKHPDAFGRTFFEVWPEVASSIEPVIAEAYAGRESFFEDLEVPVHRDGALSQAWFTFSYSPVRNSDGAILGIVCVCVETTREVLARESERLALTAQRDAFEQAPGFICTMRGPDHVFEFVNAAHRRLFGSAGWAGKPVREAFPDIAGQGFYELLDQVYETGEPISITSASVRYRLSPDREEEERLLDFTYAPLRDSTGKVTGIFCEGFDVSDQRRGEVALKESRVLYPPLAGFDGGSLLRRRYRRRHDPLQCRVCSDARLQ